jgi:hypothetical protein
MPATLAGTALHGTSGTQSIKANIETVGLLLEESRIRKGETLRLAKRSFAQGRTPAALRRAGNPGAHKEKSQPARIGFFLKSGAPGRVSHCGLRSAASRKSERPPRCGGPEIRGRANKKANLRRLAFPEEWRARKDSNLRPPSS